jgi:hypothetical protein
MLALIRMTQDLCFSKSSRREGQLRAPKKGLHYSVWGFNPSQYSLAEMQVVMVGFQVKQSCHPKA